MARVLLVEDSAGLRGVMRIGLQAAGFEVDEAPDGKRALELLRASPADVIVTDRIAAARELIEDGMNGFVVDADSPEDLGARLLQLSRAPRLARAMGRQGFERSQAFTLEVVVDRLEQFYRGCLA